MRKTLIRLMVGSGLLTSYGLAQAADDATMDPLVVTATRSGETQQDTPQVIRVITREELEQQQRITSDSSEILSNLMPSYAPPRQKMTGSGETLRGRTPLVLIDGIPQSNPLRPTGRELHTIDFSMVDHIEVIKGANATNGLGAAGGVINLVTRRPEPGSFNQHFEARVTTPTSEFDSDTDSYRTNYGFSGNRGPVDYVFSMSYEDRGLYLDGDDRPVGVDNTQGDLMNSEAYDLFGKVAYWFGDDRRLQFSVNHYRVEGEDEYVSVTGDRQADIATTSERGDPPGDAPYNRVWTTGLTWDDYDLAGMHLNVLGFYQDYESLFGATDSGSFQDPAIAPVGTLYDQSMADTRKYGIKSSLTKDDLWNDRVKLTLGFDVLRDETEQYLWLTDRTYVPPVEYSDLSPFMQVDFSPIEALTFSAGARYEYAKLDIDGYRTVAANNGVDVEGGSPSFNDTLFNAGVIWRPVDDWSLFANYSEGFSIPDVGRVLRGIDTPGSSVDDIENLRPIVTDNIETGVRYDNGRLSGELSYYISSSDFGSRLTTRNGVFEMQREKTEIEGVEASLDYRFNERHSSRLAYSHMRGRYDSNDNGTLDAKLNGLNVAPDRLVASWSADWTPKWSTFVQVNHAFDKDFDDSTNGWDLDFDGYTLVDAAVGYRLPVGRLDLAVANLFDKRYITYYSQSALDSGNADYMNDRYFAGRGRTLSVGYSVDF
ncbi:TonB-dependent receptor [Modicisalibacter radicis]|uniref:TonB-dependent receptor n=1 Tax=Halomonas sp. EAR18 TaxID=2518972 RepID=UPI001FCEE323|nr:TonB-dependent receptor [Halomonas sp. EAR18]